MPPPPKARPKGAGPPKSPREKKEKTPKPSESAAKAEAQAEFPTCEGDGHTDEADKELLDRVLKEPAATDGHINVAIRIRPPNQRELDGGAKNIVVTAETAEKVRLDAAGAGTKPQHFIYDFAIEAEASQEAVFSRIGVPIVQDAFHGYNSTMFAYGQTSSGKSFSMMGKLADDRTQGLSDMAGVIPRVAHLLFATSHSTPDTHEFFVEGSFLEIYNEKVRDLLDPSTTELKVRESPKMGVHITGLTKKQVQSSYAVGVVLNTGFENRTVASTRYNSESSRSHAIFELNIRQKYIDKASGEKMSSHSKINLVDLAGSERSDKVGTTGSSLTEGNNINKSLSVLGRCIKALVALSKLPPEQKKKGKKGATEASGGGKKSGGIKDKKEAKANAASGGGATSSIVVPFRESVLTWYLRESLSGNSRTTMLATVSPVALNHEETASTLRYAASAKNIKTGATKNEDPMEAKVRSLSEEIAKLKAALEAASQGGGGLAGRLGGDLSNMTEDERLEYLNNLEQEQAMAMGGGFAMRSRKGSTDLMSNGAHGVYPQLSCLNKDEMLSHAMTVACVPDVPGQPFTIGRDGGGRENNFVLNGVGIHPRHCQIEDMGPGGDGGGGGDGGDGASNYVISSAGSGAVVLINGQSLEELGQPAPLKHLDRITLGPCRLLALFLTEPLSGEEKANWTYEEAFRELMHRESLQWTLLGPKRRRLLDKLKEAEILYVEQANAIAIDMCTCVRFHATIILGDGVPLLRKAEATVDDVLEAGDCEVVIVCSVDPSHIVETREDQMKSVAILEAQKKLEAEADAAAAAEAQAAASKGDEDAPRRHKLVREASQMLEAQLSIDAEDDMQLSPTAGAGGGTNNADFPMSSRDHASSKGAAVGGGGADGDGGGGGGGFKLSLKEELERMNSLTLFEMKMGQFEELLAELKVTYSYVASLSQGVADGGGEHGGEGGSDDSGNTVQAIFDTVDCDGSGSIDRAELAAAFKLFDETAIDPDFCEHMMDDLLPDTMSGLDFDSFSSFLVKFLQHQYFHKLEPFVSNQRLFVCLGGRDLADTINEERKKEQALELRNAELEHEVGALRKALKNGGVDDDAGNDAEADLEAEGLDAEGEEGVLKFMKHAGLAKFGSVLVGMGVDNISDLLDPDLVGEEELGEAGLGESDILLFNDAVTKRKAKKEKLDKEASKGIGLEGSVHENFDPTIIGLDALTEVPVIIMNARSKRKLFAQSGKRPTIFETWNKGFGAGPEEHTFKDNKWWLVPQKDSTAYVIVNAHSSRKLYAKALRPGAIWEKEIGAVAADDTSPENFWNILPEADGTYTLQNASSLRKMYARSSKLGDQWTVGIGAAPNDASSTDTKWYLIPDPASMDASGKTLIAKPDLAAAEKAAAATSPRGRPSLVKLVSRLGELKD